MSAEQKLREALARQIDRETLVRRMQIEHSNRVSIKAIKDAFERITDPMENTGVATVSVDAPQVQLETVFDHPDVCEILDACKLNGLPAEVRPSTGGHFGCTFSMRDVDCSPRHYVQEEEPVTLTPICDHERSCPIEVRM